jgi:cell wall-associated NlpC family hydrolase
VGYLEGIEVVKNAKRRLGAPYVFGAERVPGDGDRLPVDCSELVEMAFREAGLQIADGSNAQRCECLFVEEEVAGNIPGALLFYRADPGANISHVGISTGQNNVIEANGGIGLVVVRPLKNGHWNEAGLPKVLYKPKHE